MVDEVERGFQVVQKAVDVGEEDLDGAAGAQEVGDFQQGHKVRAVRPAGGGGAPVDFTGALFVEHDALEDVGFEHFGEVGGDEREAVLGGEWRCHGRGRDEQA